MTLPGAEHGHNGVLLVEPHRQQPESHGAADRGEESPPVVSDGEDHRSDFDAEEDSADGGAEAACHAHRTGGGEHLVVARLVAVALLKLVDHLAEKGGDDAGNVHKGTLLAQRHPAPESRREPYHFGNERPGREVLLEHDSPKNGLHLGNPRANGLRRDVAKIVWGNRSVVIETNVWELLVVHLMEQMIQLLL